MLRCHGVTAQAIWELIPRLRQQTIVIGGVNEFMRYQCHESHGKFYNLLSLWCAKAGGLSSTGFCCQDTNLRAASLGFRPSADRSLSGRIKITRDGENLLYPMKPAKVLYPINSTMRFGISSNFLGSTARYMFSICLICSNTSSA